MKSIDIFGLRYDLLFDGQNTLKSRTGGKLTILYFIIILGLFFIFGIDLYLRKNPRVTLNNLVSENYEKMYFDNHNSTFAFRIEDVNGQFYKNNSIIQDFNISIQSLELDSFGKWVLLKDIHLQLKNCTELPNIDEMEENYNINLDSWYCIDFDNVDYLEGFWDGEFNRFLRIDTHQCINSTSNNNSCANFDTIQSEINNKVTHNQLFFSYLYMRGIAKVSNVSHPIATTLSNIYDVLDVRVTKRKYQFYKQIELENDYGWIFPQIDKSIVYCVDHEISDFVLKDSENNSLLHRNVIYMGKNIDYYSRSFMKIQELLAQIGGFSKILNILFLMIYQKIGLLIKYKKIIKKIPLANSQIIPNNPIHISIKEDLQKEVYNNINKSILSCEKQKNEENFSSIEKKIQSLDLQKLLSINDEPKISISSLLYLKSLCRKVTDSQKAIIDDFIKNREYIRNVFDVVTLVKFFKEFQFLKEIILNEEQIIALNLIKPKFNNKVKDKKISQKKLITYFASLQKEEKIHDIDRKLLESIIEEERFNSYLNKFFIE